MPCDPGLHFSRLDNGLTVVIGERPTSDHSWALRLLVQVASREEADDECGIAHFVEHMAFRGTRRFPGTSIVKWFQRQGMELGHDLTANTWFSSTVYSIDLPHGDGAALAEGLDVLFDFATGPLFEDRDIDAERRVIDAEERERSSPTQTAWTELLSRLSCRGPASMRVRPWDVVSCATPSMRRP